MTEPLNVTPDQLRATAEHLTQMSSQMKQLLSSLHGELSARGQPWGDDATGHGFADGPNGYLAQVDWVDGSIGAKTDLLDQYAGILKDTADSLEQQDQG